MEGKPASMCWGCHDRGPSVPHAAEGGGDCEVQSNDLRRTQGSASDNKIEVRLCAGGSDKYWWLRVCAVFVDVLVV